MGERPWPADLALRYEWHEGTIPPPGYYEYAIRVGADLRGEIVFRPDYGMHRPPVWTEVFAAAETALAHVYALLLEKGVLSRQWPEREPRAIGGSVDRLEVTAHGKHAVVSSKAQGAAELAELFVAVRALVPDPIWQSLRARHAEFQQRFYEEEGR